MWDEHPSLETQSLDQLHLELESPPGSMAADSWRISSSEFLQNSLFHLLQHLIAGLMHKEFPAGCIKPAGRAFPIARPGMFRLNYLGYEELWEFCQTSVTSLSLESGCGCCPFERLHMPQRIPKCRGMELQACLPKGISQSLVILTPGLW